MPTSQRSASAWLARPRSDQKPRPTRSPAARTAANTVSGCLAARDRRDDLVFLGLGIERRVVDDVLAVDLPRDRAATFARFAQDLFRRGDLRARLLSVGSGRVPFE